MGDLRTGHAPSQLDMNSCVDGVAVSAELGQACGEFVFPERFGEPRQVWIQSFSFSIAFHDQMRIGRPVSLGDDVRTARHPSAAGGDVDQHGLVRLGQLGTVRELSGERIILHRIGHFASPELSLATSASAE